MEEENQTAETADEKIRERILAALDFDQRTSGAGLRVGVLNGVVHLAGYLDSLLRRSAAEQIANQVSGVRGVVNRIEGPGGPSPARVVQLDLKNIFISNEAKESSE